MSGHIIICLLIVLLVFLLIIIDCRLCIENYSVRNGNNIKVEFARDEFSAQTSQILVAIWVIVPKIWRWLSQNS